ncbi:hypothetical protein ANN_11446 [Periplaneta americana]|uniref:Cytochrome c oxidase polypeptide II n=1 Tax=Periplaneta americana TaxID=6978 RepID=A0ABQ8T6S2_PERAM|nr:hypothetical protein ANN_11446 [Periplaneta americana]
MCSYWVEGKPGKNLNQVTCPDRESKSGHLVSRPDALPVTPQVWTASWSQFILHIRMNVIIVVVIIIIFVVVITIIIIIIIIVNYRAKEQLSYSIPASKLKEFDDSNPAEDMDIEVR